jgi:sulfur relay (sulfurtransferase) complex TusBCD TusD component (DsrE family)
MQLDEDEQQSQRIPLKVCGVCAVIRGIAFLAVVSDRVQEFDFGRLSWNLGW